MQRQHRGRCWTTIVLAAGLLVSAGAHTQQAAPAQVPPAWEQLSQAQRDEIIAPLRERWNRDPGERTRMLERSRRWQSMTPDQRQRARHGMRRWQRMDPEKQAQMRALFERTRNMPGKQRHETMVLFREMLPMTPQQRVELKSRWQAMSPAQRDAWVEQHVQARGAHGDGHRRGPRRDRD